MEPARKIVLGLGNTLNRDEGLGVHAVKLLETKLRPPDDSGAPPPAEGLEFLDGGVLGLNLLPLVEEASHLLVLDAIDARKEAGTLIEMSRDEIPLYSGIKLSDHQVTFQEVLGLASFRGKLPGNLHLIGIQPADLSIGLDLSPIVAATLPRVLTRAEAVLQDWRLLNDDKSLQAANIRELEKRIVDLKGRWPAHSTPPALLQQLDELETELEKVRLGAAA
jgi:hydrogenase maturation protease